MKSSEVIASKKFEKQLRRIPEHIKRAVSAWIGDVEDVGIRKVRTRKGYHDEALKGSDPFGSVVLTDSFTKKMKEEKYI